MNARRATFVSSSIALSLAAFVATPAGAAEKYKVDAVHSTVIFRIHHMGASYCYGRFNDISGSFTLDEANPSASSIDVTVKTESVDTANKDRDKHLKGPDFFNAKQFPNLSFKSTAFKKAGDKKYEVTGDLTCHGVTKPITVTIEHTGSAKERAGLESTFNIDRKDYGLTGMTDGLGTDIRLIVALEGTK